MRCSVINIDPKTGTKNSAIYLALSKTRKENVSIFFDNLLIFVFKTKII